MNMDELQRMDAMGMMQFLQGMLQPGKSSKLSPEEDKMLELCCHDSPTAGQDTDEKWAAELDKLLKAAKSKGKPCNLEAKSMSGATALVMAALSNGLARVRVLLKHGAQLAGNTLSNLVEGQ